MSEAPALRIKQTIQNEGSATSRASVHRMVSYDMLDESQIMQLWMNHKASLGDGEYSGSEWIAPSTFEDKHSHICWDDSFRYNDHLKTFLLLHLEQGTTPYTTVNRVRMLQDFLIATNSLSDNAFPDFEDDPYLLAPSGHFRDDLVLFCSYAGIIAPDYIDILRGLRYDVRARKIPAFESIQKFDRLVSLCQQEQDIPALHTIVILWWELTKVIPIRPIEFFTLRRNSFFIENGKHYIKVQRAKLRHSKHEVPILNKIGISDHIYTLFDNYRKQFSQYLPAPDSFLFNTDVFQSFSLAMRLGRDGYIGSNQMYKLFYAFFEEIVHGKFHYAIVEKGGERHVATDEIERFQYGDSRHIAFLNLLLSGFSPYTIAQIGGHTTIRQQMHYYDHLETYLASKAYAMASETGSAFQGLADGFDVREKYAISRVTSFLNPGSLAGMRRIEIGYCSSENFPYECEFDDCLNCRYCIVDEKHQHTIPIKIASYQADIHTQVEFLKKLLQNPSLGTDADRATAVNAINTDTAAIASLLTKQRGNEV